MEKIEYNLELPDPYENAYKRAIMELENRLRSREMEGIEAALAEYGYVKERTCVSEGYGNMSGSDMPCGYCSECTGEIPNGSKYCPECGAKVVE